MPAELIPFGNYACGAGGDFERECAGALRDQLPDGYIVITNVYLPRWGAGFYECDAIVAAPGICDVLEMKCVRPEIIVGEDIIVSSTGHTIERPLSIVDLKAKILASRRQRSPFLTTGQHGTVKVGSQVVVPSSTRISFKPNPPTSNPPVRTLADTIAKYQELARATAIFKDSAIRRETRNAWVAFRDASAPAARRTQWHLGRFAVRRQLSSDRGVYEYAGVDETPVRMEVRLREFPFDPALPTKDLDVYLKQVARESSILMKVRHPFVSCVVGHFQTGCSWVQVSDWFDGKTLNELWPILANATLAEKAEVFIKVIQALEFCHEKGVFHRNLTADSVWVSADLADVRVGRFDCALDLSTTSTLSGTVLSLRDPRVVAPEELQTGRCENARLADIFQAGVLLYRLLENGDWPFSDTLDYVTGGGHIRSFSEASADSETKRIRTLALQMMHVVPSRRPDLLSRVEQELRRALAGPRE
jgi:serine/threonine protein kinase